MTSQSPYAPPKANVLRPEPRVKRPVLIWFTQALLLFVITLLVFWGIGQLRVGLVIGNSRLVAVALGIAIVPSSIFLALFIGLARRRRWAQWGSIAFAVLLLMLGIWNAFHPPQYASSAEAGGGAIGSLVVIALMVLYPIRLYRSASVREFFREDAK